MLPKALLANLVVARVVVLPARLLKVEPHALATVISKVVRRARCIVPFVPSAEKRLRSRLSQLVRVLYIAPIALKLKMVTAIVPAAVPAAVLVTLVVTAALLVAVTRTTATVALALPIVLAAMAILTLRPPALGVVVKKTVIGTVTGIATATAGR